MTILHIKHSQKPSLSTKTQDKVLKKLLTISDHNNEIQNFDQYLNEFDFIERETLTRLLYHLSELHYIDFCPEHEQANYQKPVTRFGNITIFAQALKYLSDKKSNNRQNTFVNFTTLATLVITVISLLTQCN